MVLHHEGRLTFAKFRKDNSVLAHIRLMDNQIPDDLKVVILDVDQKQRSQGVRVIQNPGIVIAQTLQTIPEIGNSRSVWGESQAKSRFSCCVS